MKGIRAILRILEDVIEGITPKTDITHRFLSMGSGDGFTGVLDLYQNQNRIFEILLDSLSQDDGQAGLSGRKRTGFKVRVKYDLNELQSRKLLASEDSSYIIEGLKDPNNYQTNLSGIINIIPQGGGVLEESFEQETNPTIYLNLNFDLLYLES